MKKSIFNSYKFSQITEVISEEGVCSLIGKTKKEIKKISHRSLLKYYRYIKHRQHWEKSSVADPDMVYFVDTERLIWRGEKKTIKYISKENERLCRPIISGGEWDKYKTDMRENIFYNSAKDHFTNGAEWIETERYKQRVNRGECKSEVLNKLQYYDGLYNDILKNGFDPSYPVRVLIGRCGEYLIIDGTHRVSIAKIIGINEIPVIVVARHKEWQEYRSKYAKSKQQGIKIEGEDHPDLSDI